MKRLQHTTLGFTAIGLLTLTACGGDNGGTTTVDEDCEPVVEGVETANEGQLTAAVAEYPPYVTGAGGDYAGVDGELLTEVASALCLEPNFETQSFTAIIEAVRNGNADLSAGNWYINEERQEQFEVSDPVYADQMAIVSEEGITSVDDLEGYSVGTTQGYLWVEDLQDVLGSSNVSLYETEQDIYQDVAVGRIEAGVITYGGGVHLLESNQDEETHLEVFEPDDRIEASVGSPESAVLIQPGNTTLLEGVNAVIQELHETGEIEDLLAEYGLPESAAEVTGEVAE